MVTPEDNNELDEDETREMIGWKLWQKDKYTITEQD